VTPPPDTATNAPADTAAARAAAQRAAAQVDQVMAEIARELFVGRAVGALMREFYFLFFTVVRWMAGGRTLA
jgi:hypothetical protein